MITNLLLVVLLIIATAFFVATEFAIIRIRSSRVDQMVLEGIKNARGVQKVVSDLDGYLSACQLGITITALGLGWLGEPAVESVLHPILYALGLPKGAISVISFIMAFVFITFLHVVLGELAPKTVAIQKAENVSLLFANPIIWFKRIMYPFIWLLNGSANKVVGIFGLKPAKEHEESHSEEELRIILSESYKSGNINQTEYGYVNRIFAFDELHAREIMVPRTDMVCLDANHSLEENLKVIKDEQYTRFPVIDMDKDHIIGIVNTKQFFLQHSDNPNVEMSKLIQPAVFVTEAMSVHALLKKMQKQQTHLAIIVDEYGGTSGMVTIEDILEEIVGEIRDEFDNEEKPQIEYIQDGHIIVDGKVSLISINDIFGYEIEDAEFNTIGGWLYNQNVMLKKEQPWEYNGLIFVIKDKEGHRIRRVEITKKPINQQ